MQTEMLQIKDEKEEVILHLDFHMIKMKLMDKSEGLGWTYNQSEVAEFEYKKFLILIYRYPEINIVPTKLMDAFWHFHILDTQKYYDDCHLIFGRLIHHFPYFGMRGKADELNLVRSFQKTKRLYKLNFGCAVDSAEARCGSGSNCVSTKCGSTAK